MSNSPRELWRYTVQWEDNTLYIFGSRTLGYFLSKCSMPKEEFFWTNYLENLRYIRKPSKKEIQ